MKIEEIIAKVLKGEQPTDDEKKFLTEFNLQKQLDASASAARKKAEQERDEFKTKIDELTSELEEAKKSGQTSNDTIVKLQKDDATLMKANKESEEKIAAQARTDAIRKAVSDAKIVCAKGISQTLFDNAISTAFNGVDVANADVVKATLDAFKKDNPALIGVDGVGGVGQQGKPDSRSGIPEVNPFSKKSFNLTEGLKLMQTNPEVAKQLQAEAQAEAAS